MSPARGQTSTASPPRRCDGAKGFCDGAKGLAMRLVSPDRVLYIVADKAELKALVKRLGLGWKLGGNLRQLCGWDETGGGDEKGNWQRLESVVWLKHDTGTELVPLVGKVSHMYTSVVQSRPDMIMGEESLRKLVPSRTGKTYLDVVNGWRRAAMPLEVMELGDGASLVGFTASASTPAPAPAPTPAPFILPDYGAGLSLTPQEAEVAWAHALPRTSRELRDAAAGANGSPVFDEVCRAHPHALSIPSLTRRWVPMVSRGRVPAPFHLVSRDASLAHLPRTCALADADAFSIRFAP